MLDIELFHRTVRRLKKFNPKRVNIIKANIYKGVENMYPYDAPESLASTQRLFRSGQDTKRTFIVNGDGNGKAFIVGSCTDEYCTNTLDYEAMLEDVTIDEIVDYITDLISDYRGCKIVILRNTAGDAIVNELINQGFRDYLYRTYNPSTDTQSGDEIVTYGIKYDIGIFVKSMEELGKWVIEDLKPSNKFSSKMIPYELLSINLKEVTASKKMDQISTKDYSDNLVVQTWAVAMLYHTEKLKGFSTPILV